MRSRAADHPEPSPTTPVDALRERITTLAHTTMDRAPMPTGWGSEAPRLDRGAIHEWYSPVPALTVLSALAAQAIAEPSAGAIVWVGRSCWASLGSLRNPRVLERSVFVDPPNDADRGWAIDQALRCAAVACVIADGRGIDMGLSRRLQLAAAEGGAIGLLARPPDEERALSAARTRWRVAPAPDGGACGVEGAGLAGPAHRSWFPEPRWTVELLRCKGVLQPTRHARRWVVRWSHDTGDVALVPDAPDRGVQTPAQRQRA
ncbi:MAG: ImuA family protein [Phycisphaerales bacterium]